ncbi:hypothetical protein J6590_041425 [Homalodisca vitripennis]|nr:hypothetical protein J6590_041425 [Homalodisca vitripennis]
MMAIWCVGWRWCSAISRKLSIWTGFGQLFHETPARFLRQTKGHSQELKVSAPAKPQGQYPRLTAIPATSFTCGAVKGKMVADPETNCQLQPRTI